jgi:hypothetical protein
MTGDGQIDVPTNRVPPPLTVEEFARMRLTDQIVKPTQSLVNADEFAHAMRPAASTPNVPMVAVGGTLHGRTVLVPASASHVITWADERALVEEDRAGWHALSGVEEYLVRPHSAGRRRVLMLIEAELWRSGNGGAVGGGKGVGLGDTVLDALAIAAGYAR